MHRAMLASLTIVAMLLGILPGSGALGSVERPSYLQAPAPLNKAAELPKTESAEAKRRNPSSFFARIKQEVLAKLRPVDKGHNIDFNAAASLLNSKTTIQKVFNENFEEKMRNQYAAQVLPFEATATNPIWRPRHWEMQRYEESRQGLAKWTAREVLDDQLHDFIKGGDSDSAPIKVLETAQELSGGGRDDNEPTKLTEEQKIARAHRRDLPPVAEEEQKIPTRLKTKINVIKQHGSIVFQNPVATTSVNGSSEEINVNMNKEFPKITLGSQANYHVKGQVMSLSLNKKITDQVSLALDHYSWTGGKRGGSGEKSKEQARVNYSVSF